ncbi:MAG: hypothetical protein FJZ90_11605 [Chloroflexi bacterium]|nr:hypothetical protein [Chloroflexota bacterium]
MREDRALGAPSVIASLGASWRVRLIRAFLVVWFTLAPVISVLGLALLAYGWAYANRIFQGVTILGVHVGGLSPDEALQRVSSTRSGCSLPYVSLTGQDQEWTLSLCDLGGRLDMAGAVEQAWSLGRSGVFRRDWLARLALLWRGYDVVPTFALESGPALVYLRHIARSVGHPARRAELWVDGLQARVDASQEGRELDLGRTMDAIEAEVQRAMGSSGWREMSRIARPGRVRAGAGLVLLEPIAVPLRFRTVVPPLTEVAGAEEQVRAILQWPLSLVVDAPSLGDDGSVTTTTRHWMVDRATLASWLTLEQGRTGGSLAVRVEVSGDRVRELMLRLDREIAQPSRPARYQYDAETGELWPLEPGQMGYALDVQAATLRVMEACVSAQREVPLPLTLMPPPVMREDLARLLPLSLISEGESSFQGSTPERLRNIRLAAARFHGVAVPPGAVFSFLEHLGPVTTANGYSPSWIILGDRTVLGPGGGVCQVSTTCFRAAFWGGYPLVERWPHTYRVGWYEPPIGFDAAVFSGVTDFKFRNDTETPLLIQTAVDESRARLYFRFYGSPRTRQVSMEGPVTANPVKAGDPILEPDARLQPGARVLVDQAHDGIDVTLYRVVEEDGQTVREKIYSRYEPWPARYRVGPASR